MSIDATAGGVSSNSYSDVATADAYHATRLHNSEWLTTSTADKEAALKWATRTLDEQQWTGTKATTTQALRWPRKLVYNRDGELLSDATIPKFLADAVAELALDLIKEDRNAINTLSDFSTLTLDGVGSIQVNNDEKVKAVLGRNVTALFSFYVINGGMIRTIRI